MKQVVKIFYEKINEIEAGHSRTPGGFKPVGFETPGILDSSKKLSKRKEQRKEQSKEKNQR